MYIAATIAHCTFINGHTLRANPFPEVTDLFCRLPLSTLFYQLEAVHLGDLLRLSVRPVVMNCAAAFSRTVKSFPDSTINFAKLFQAILPISG